MQKRITPLSRGQRERISVLSVPGPTANISLKIECRLPPRQRRTIALAFFRHLRPWVEHMRSASIGHVEEYLPNFARDESRTLSLNSLETYEEDPVKFGFKVRMRRLNLGLSQLDLSLRTGLAINRISLIERGLTDSRIRTRVRLQQALGMD